MLVLVVFSFWKEPETLAVDPNELSVVALRLENLSRVLQLNISWDGAFAEKSSLYDVKINHIPTTNCSIEQSHFADRPDIKCAPLVGETEHTSLILPRDTRALHKHECEILPSCVYEVVVKPLDFISTLQKVYRVPDCVNDLCSCFYEKFLPSIHTNATISADHLVVNWTLGEYSSRELPDDVSLEHIMITVRRVLNEDLHWGGQESSKKSVTMPATMTGGFQFNVADFPGNKTVFLVHVTLYDSRRCISEARPVRVSHSAKDARPGADPIDTLDDMTSLKGTVIVLAGFAVLGSILLIIMINRRRNQSRRVTETWSKVYVSSENRSLPSMQMEENRLYVDKEILDAIARGEADPLLEVQQSCLRIGREIGKGAFGRVFMATATKLAGFQGPVIVAVKQLKKSSRADEMDEFREEIAMMKRVGRHPNIVTLLGCCTIKEPLTMIMEYIGCGDLLEYLRKVRAKHMTRVAQYSGSTIANPIESSSLPGSTSNHSEITVFGPTIKYLDIGHTSNSNSDASYITQPETTLRPSLTDTMYTTLSGRTAQEQNSLEYVLDHNELHDFARQISCGMQHLEQKHITHRDLAARNILIDERKTLKISDFGLSRTGIYINTKNKKVPLRWLSIEAMRDNLYSSKSDVWAFGIVLWEIGTLGGYPYPTVSNHELLSYLHNGNRLERPENCTSELYELMQNCWKPDPDDRPSFQEISKSLEPHRRIYIDFNEIEPTYVFPPTSEQIKQVIANNKS